MGQDFHFMEGDSRAVVVGPLFLAIMPPPGSKLFSVEPITLENGSFMEQETAPCIFEYLVGGADVVQDDL